MSDGRTRRAERRAARKSRRGGRRERRQERRQERRENPGVIRETVTSWLSDPASGPVQIPGPGPVPVYGAGATPVNIPGPGPGPAFGPGAPGAGTGAVALSSAPSWWMDPKILALGAAALFILMRKK